MSFLYIVYIIIKADKAKSKMDVRPCMISDGGFKRNSKFNKNEPKALIEAFRSGIKICRCEIYMDDSNPKSPVPRLIDFDIELAVRGKEKSYPLLGLFMIMKKEYPDCKLIISFDAGSVEDWNLKTFLSVLEEPGNIYSPYFDLIHSILFREDQTVINYGKRTRQLGMKVSHEFEMDGYHNYLLSICRTFWSATFFNNVDIIFFLPFDLENYGFTGKLASMTDKVKWARLLKMFRLMKPAFEFGILMYMDIEIDNEYTWNYFARLGFKYIVSCSDNIEMDSILIGTETYDTCPKKRTRSQKTALDWKS